MPADAVAHLPGEVQATPVVLEHVDDAQALLVVPEPSRHERVEHALAGVAERRMTQVVAEGDRLGQLLVEPKHLRDRARDLRDLERVREARAVVIALRREEHLRLVLQPPERFSMDDAVAVVLKRRPHIVFLLAASDGHGTASSWRLAARASRARAVRAPHECSTTRDYVAKSFACARGVAMVEMACLKIR